QKYHPLVLSLVRADRSNRQIEERCRSEGYNESLSTLNGMITAARRQARADAPTSYAFRQKIINILWDFKKGHHMERLLQLHPTLLETFPEIIELEQLVHSFRNLFNENRISTLDN